MLDDSQFDELTPSKINVKWLKLKSLFYFNCGMQYLKLELKTHKIEIGYIFQN